MSLLETLAGIVGPANLLTGSSILGASCPA